MDPFSESGWLSCQVHFVDSATPRWPHRPFLTPPRPRAQQPRATTRSRGHQPTGQRGPPDHAAPQAPAPTGLLALPPPPGIDIAAGLRALGLSREDLQAELAKPLATIPCVPRSLVLPLAAVIADLASQIVGFTVAGDWEAATTGWLVFLALPRLLLHCSPRQELRQDNVDGEASLSTVLHERLHQFQASRWDLLLHSSRELAPSGRKAPQVPDNRVDDRRWGRACYLASLGELRRAMQALTSLGLAPGAPAELAGSLRNLLRQSDPTSWADMPPLVDALLLSPEVLRKALRKGGRGAAPGPSGWRYEHLRVVLQLPEAEVQFHGLCQLLVDGAVPRVATDMLGAASITPLAKASGGVRPLAVGEALRRVCARAVCMQCRDLFEEDLSPHQFAVGLAGGCEAILKCIDVRTQEDPDSVVIALDVRNAYNSILRGACLRSLRRLRPELAAFADLFYRRHSSYTFRGADGAVRVLTATEGVEQGDALAPALFAYGLRPALVRAQVEIDALCLEAGVPRALLLAYLDDIVIVAPSGVAEAAYTIVQACLAEECSLELSADKTQVWTPSQVRPPGGLARHWSAEGMVVLGGPLGDLRLSTAIQHDDLRPQAVPYGPLGGPFLAEFLDARLHTMRGAADAVLGLVCRAPHDFPALQIALQLLVFCVAPKADHLLRHLPPPAGTALAANIDRLLLETFQSLFEVRLSADQAEQASFALVRGGLGCRRRGGGCELGAFLGSWALVYHKVVATLGWHFTAEGPSVTFRKVQEAAEAAAEAGAPSARLMTDLSWWGAASGAPVPNIQATVARAIRARHCDAWLARAGPKAAARLHTHSGWGSGAALLRCPTELALRVPDDAVRTAVCERLGLPLCAPGRCGVRFASGRCCRHHNRRGAHAHCCPGTIGARTRFRHNPLVGEFHHFLSLAGRCVAVEQRDPHMGPHARLDIVEYPSAEGGPAAYDVTVVTALRKDRAFVAAGAQEPGFAGRRAHERKLHEQYAARLPGARLVPLVVEVGGRWHASVPPLLRRWARAYVARAPGLGPEAAGLAVARWAARLSAALLRGNAAALRRAGYSIPPRCDADVGDGAPLAHLVPEGPSAYELLVGS